MKKYLMVLFVGFLSIAMSGISFAKPDYPAGTCGGCHGVPVVTNFQLPSSHDSTTVPIDSFMATDSDRYNKTRVNGYLLTTSAAAPSSSDPGWQSSPPSQFTFTADGLQTLYAWAKDTFGSVSTAASDVVDILIVVPNSPPVADAGPNQTVKEGVTVTLNASNSDDSDDGIDSYLWEQVPGAVAVDILNPSAVKPTFNTPNVGPGGVALTFRLTVADAAGDTDTDTTIVNVSWVNIEPVANAGGDRTVAEGTPVTLDGSASDGVDDGI
ncbi:PKD domain-containing protein, partial [Desulfosarcina sp.]|uniref:PKD domain-containing protein n=1 Tax=Desulfosarcina sp. TaxID=2027861 RepID=UPI0029AC6B48